jgi:hypothetical protein
MTVPMNRRLRRLVVGLLLGGTLPLAYAQGLVIHGHSHHTTGDYNNANYGIGYRTSDNVIFGAYRNSEGANTAYVAYDWRVNPYFGIALGGSIGYRNAPVMPVVMPTFTLPLTNNVGLSLGVMPMYSADTRKAGLVFHTMMEIRL